MPWRLSGAAEADLVEILDYIEERNSGAAARLLDQCFDRFDMFVRQPLIGEMCDPLRPGIRQFTVGKYVIYYRHLTEVEIVEIVRIIHGARDIEAIFADECDERLHSLSRSR